MIPQEIPDPRPGAQLQRELDATLKDISTGLTTHDHDIGVQDLGDHQRPTRIAPVRQPRVTSVVRPRTNRTREFPDGGLDLDLFDDALIDGDAVQTRALQACNDDRERLQDEIDRLDGELHLLKDEHVQDLQIAEIDLETVKDELKAREDDLLILQQQLDDPKSTGSAVGTVDHDDDATRLVEMNDMRLAQTMALREEVVEANDTIEALKAQVTDWEARYDILRKRLSRGQTSQDATGETHDDTDFINGLLAEVDTLQKELAAHRRDSTYDAQEHAERSQELERYKAYTTKRNEAMKQREDRLDALWVHLRNFKDLDDSIQEMHELRARITYFEGLMRNAKDHINETADAGDSAEVLIARSGGATDGEVDRYYHEQISTLSDVIKNTNRELDVANQRIQELEGEADGNVSREVYDQEAEEWSEMVQRYVDRIHDATVKLNASLAANAGLRRTIRELRQQLDGTSQGQDDEGEEEPAGDHDVGAGEEPAEDHDDDEAGEDSAGPQDDGGPQETGSSLSDMLDQLIAAQTSNAALRRTIGQMEQKKVNTNDDLDELRQTNADLQQTIGQIEQQRVNVSEELEELRETNARFHQTCQELLDAQDDDEGEGQEVSSLRQDLRAAREEIARLQAGAHDVEDDEPPFDDSGFVEEGTPVAQDELPRAKRTRRSPSEVDSDYDGQGGNDDLDHLFSPSSFMESEPSPLLPRVRRSGRTRRQSQRLRRDQDEAQFQRDLAAAAPADPRGLVVVIDRGEVVRARGSKRKR